MAVPSSAAIGTLKKGKVARQALELLARSSEVSQRERELLRGVPEMDMINALVSHRGISWQGHAVVTLVVTLPTQNVHASEVLHEGGNEAQSICDVHSIRQGVVTSRGMHLSRLVLIALYCTLRKQYNCSFFD
jgi:hypothetical protein